MLSCLLDLPLHLHLLLFGHPLFRSQMFELVILVPRTSLWRSTMPHGILYLLHRLDQWCIFDVDTVLPADGHSTLVHKVDHFLSHDGHLENLGN